ncbi:MAG: DoxX family protein [Parafilimonas sp.]
MKRNKTIYYISTSIICAVMLFSIINFTFIDRYPFAEGAFNHLHLPLYFKIELTTAKALGLLALLIPNLPVRIKQFAYFGFAITLISATIAHASTGDPFFPFIIDPILFLIALIFSYVYYHKIHQLKY